jgi:NAD dependent epimerase/dehydratase family enzyme
VTNRELTAALGDVLHRPTVMTIPRLVSHLPFGVGDLLDGLLFISQKVQPAVLEREGFTFADTELEATLRSLVGRADGG